MSTNEQNLGRLEPVDELREVWPNEADDFTPWLAKEENLALLGSTIDLGLELEAQEKNVGPFRADILCKDTASNDWVLVENQLERTDHTHLGQLLTYAAGLKAVTIVWIADRFRDSIKDGTLVAGYLIGYSIIRFFMDYWRTDGTSAQNPAIVFAAIGALYLIARYQPWRPAQRAV